MDANGNQMPAGGIAQPVTTPTGAAGATPTEVATQPAMVAGATLGTAGATPVQEVSAVQPAAVGGVTIEPLLEECVKREASDLHLQVGLPPILRLDGVLHPITT